MLSTLLTALLATSTGAPPELGDVTWLRSFDRAADKARGSDKPLLVLFDEVPGCQTCVRYGASVLSHPLLVEAAETLFVPVAIYNNVGGPDRKVLERFREPSWNNPVVRITTPEGRDLAPRLAGDYRVEALAARMVRSLRRAGHAPPQWLTLVAEEVEPTTRVYFGMHCFWSGEACLGALDSVLATRTGWMNGTEVVEVELRKGQEAAAVRAAAAAGCAQSVFAADASILAAASASGLKGASPGRFRATPSDDLHVLRRTSLAALPLAPLQASRVNAALARRAPVERWLSPRQSALAARLKGRKGLPDPRQSESLAVAQRRLIAALDRATR